MSLKSLLALIDDKLEETFLHKAPSAEKGRAKAIKQIEVAKRRFAATEPQRGKSSFKVANDVVAFTPGYAIAGKPTSYVPASRFNDFLTNLEKAISAGELDDALTADNATVASGESTVKRAKRKPLSDEAKAAMTEKRRATMAANGTKPGKKTS